MRTQPCERNLSSSGNDVEEQPISWCELELPLGEAAQNFDLATAVCSHGLFMMPPNNWDPVSRTFSRPLRLSLDENDADSSSSVTVRISHPEDRPHSLLLRVVGTRFLSSKHERALMDQVVRMLRLSDTEEKNVEEFLKICADAKWLKSFSGRVFRSPTLFEDMVKCILLCNCQWPRTLSMAGALCELQLELQQHQSSNVSLTKAGSMTIKCQASEKSVFIPKTPARKESKRKKEPSIASAKSSKKIVDAKARLDADASLTNGCVRMKAVHVRPMDPDSSQNCSSCPNEAYETNYNSVLDYQPKETIPDSHDQIGNFPSPRELAGLEEKFLAKRCNLGYRAGRILKLAQSIVDGQICLEHFEETCKEATSSSYDKLSEQLRNIEGFGPFTCANVLMCMGFYHVIPTDSETIRHLKQVHGRISSIQTVQRDIEAIYRMYAPYQFLAYWAELWQFYEQRFGKLSEIPCSEYKLITASNMKIKGRETKRRKIS